LGIRSCGVYHASDQIGSDRENVKNFWSCRAIPKYKNGGPHLTLKHAEPSLGRANLNLIHIFEPQKGPNIITT
jgi:hypothetical protein